MLLNVRLAGGFMRHNSSLVCMAVVTCVYVDIIVLCVHFKTHLYCLVTYLSTIVWARVVLSVLHAYLWFVCCFCFFFGGGVVFALVQRS